MLCKLYGRVHRTAKKVLGKSNDIFSKYNMVSFSDKDFLNDILQIPQGYNGEINEINPAKHGLIKKNEVYPIENLVSGDFSVGQATFPGIIIRKYSEPINLSVEKLWDQFIVGSSIQNGYKHAGCHYAGYIKDVKQWCLPSWIWTNGAITRYYCAIGEIEKAKELGDIIISYQHPCGGWIVRNDYSSKGIIPELAPNDSAYIANNCCLELYLNCGEEKYLRSAIQNADWIMKTARTDGLVYFGYDMKNAEWITDRNIVDTGFTAALFARLYHITKNEDYRVFLNKFVQKFIEVFYMPKNKCFATAVDGNDRQKGGAFGRGQAWALEGLIPAYDVVGSRELENVIVDTINTILVKQRKSGGWSYNLLKPLMGVDCKATSVIAKSLLEWNKIFPDKRLVESAKKAICWCEEHTEKAGEAAGGIFSYTIEGAIVHHMYTRTAFVYSSCYATEVKLMLEK